MLFRSKPPNMYGSVDPSQHGILLKVLKSEHSSAQSHLDLLSCNTLEPTTTHGGDKIFCGLNTTANSQIFLPCISTSDTEHICIFVKSSVKKGIILARHTLLWNPRYAILLLHHCLWEFSTSSMIRVQWDPGVPEVLHSSTANCPMGTRPGIFTHVLQSIFGSAVKCFIAFGLEWTEVELIATAALILYVPCFKGKSEGQHSLCSYQTTTVAGQTIIFPSSATKSVQMIKHKHPLDFFLLAELQNWSDIRVGQLAYMPQGTSINRREGLGHMVIVLSCWSPSFETAKLQWDPGIANSSHMCKSLEMTAVKTETWLHMPLLNYLQCQLPLSNTPCNEDKFFHQPDVPQKYNAKKLLLPSSKYLQILEMDIIFITFLPP